jgi:hypothetical protein
MKNNTITIANASKQLKRYFIVFLLQQDRCEYNQFSRLLHYCSKILLLCYHFLSKLAF